MILLITVLLGFTLWKITIAELNIGWKMNRPLLYKMRPTLYRTTRIYKVKLGNIMGINYENMEEIFVSVDKYSKTIFFRKKMFSKIFELSGPCPFWGTIELIDLDDKIQATFIGKPPFSTLYTMVCICILILINLEGFEDIFLSWWVLPVIYALMLVFSYIIEKRKFIRHISDIENLLHCNGIIPERDFSGGLN